MELICIDGLFSPQQKKLIPNRVELDRIYTIREIVRVLVNGGFKYAILVNELENPELEDEVTGMMFEPSFKIQRFAHLAGGKINSAQLYRKWVKQNKNHAINS